MAVGLKVGLTHGSFVFCALRDMRNGQRMMEPEWKCVVRSTLFEQTFASTSTHSLDSIDSAVESY